MDRNDLISRKALRKAINELAIPIYGKMVLKAIDNAPTVSPERPKGEWVEIERQGKTGDGRVFTFTIIVCSNCGEQFDLEGEKYCPHCGAEMQKGGVE